MPHWPPAGESTGVDLDHDHATPQGPTLLEWIGFALGCARRRKLLVALSFLACLGVFAAFYANKPAMYRVEARVLTLDRSALPTAARSVYEEAPGRSAYDLIHRRENLVALIRHAELLPDPETGTTASGASAAPSGGTDGQDDKLEALLSRIDRQLDVTADAGAITIALEWPEPRVAYALVKSALDNFLEARHLQEVSSIDEIISVLEGHAAKLRQELDDALEHSQRRLASQPKPAVPRVRNPSETLVRLQSLAAAKERALQDIEEIRRRRLVELQAQLDQARNTLSDAHPTVIGLRKDIEAASRESPQLQAIRQEEQEVRERYHERLEREGFGPSEAARAALPQVIAPGAREEDPRVRQAQTQYDQMTARINAARVELDAARAAFKYRYNVVWPPQLPTAPVSPNAVKIFGVGFVAALVVALFAAIVPDLLNGRIVHRLQVERTLGIQVLGEIHRRH